MQWEYRVESFARDAAYEQQKLYLNECGLEGWELTGVVRRSTGAYVYYFKRMLD